jgi:hypothetical protein
MLTKKYNKFVVMANVQIFVVEWKTLMKSLHILVVAPTTVQTGYVT